MASRASGSSALALLIALASAPAWAAGAPRTPAPAPAPVSVPVESIDLEMDALDGEVLFKKDKSDTSKFRGAIVMPDGKRLPMTISTKGGFTQGFAKKPLVIKLDKGYEWHGEHKLALNAMSVDRSKMREWLAWDLIHTLGMVAPDTSYIAVNLNGKPRGLFFRIEWIDPDLYERFGWGKDVDMYDPVDKISCADLSFASVKDPETCWGNVTHEGHFETLLDLVKAIDREPVDTFDKYLDAHFDSESVINYIAVTILTSNTTTYNDEYFLDYSYAKSKWFVIPWAYDRSFGWAYEPSLQEPAASDNENFQYDYALELGAYNPLRDKVIMNPELQARLVRRLGEIVGTEPAPGKPWAGWFTPQRTLDRIAAMRAAIAPYLARDPFLQGQDADIAEKQGALQHYVRRRSEYLKRVLDPRGEWQRDSATAPLPAPGHEAVLTDGWGYQMADVAVRSSSGHGALTASVWHGAPELVPPGTDRNACVQRSWFLQAQDSAQADLTLEYLQPSILLSELGPAVHDEKRLQLYLRDARGWWRLPTTVNALANTLATPDVSLPRGERVRLVACEDTTPATAPASAAP